MIMIIKLQNYVQVQCDVCMPSAAYILIIIGKIINNIQRSTKIFN